MHFTCVHSFITWGHVMLRVLDFLDSVLSPSPLISHELKYVHILPFQFFLHNILWHGLVSNVMWVSSQFNLMWGQRLHIQQHIFIVFHDYNNFRVQNGILLWWLWGWLYFFLYVLYRLFGLCILWQDAHSIIIIISYQQYNTHRKVSCCWLACLTCQYYNAHSVQ